MLAPERPRVSSSRRFSVTAGKAAIAGLPLLLILAVVTTLLGIRLLYSLFYERMPRLFWLFLVSGALAAVCSM